MRISVKLKSLPIGVVVLFVALSAVLLMQLRVVATGYDSLLQNPVREADLARVAQVDFKKQEHRQNKRLFLFTEWHPPKPMSDKPHYVN